MLFNSTDKRFNCHSFKYNNYDLDITNEYCYLGIVFVLSGSFTKSTNRLKDKALKAKNTGKLIQ